MDRLNVNMPNKRSCDQCYKKKAKCQFQNDAKKCARCERLDIGCSTIRPIPHQGRWPKAIDFGPGGSVHLWTNTRYAGNTEGRREHVTRTRPPASEHESISSTDQRSKPTELDKSTDGALVGNTSTISLLEYNFSASGQELWHSVPNFSEFYAANDIFMLGPSFAQKLQTTLQVAYEYSPNLLQDIYVGMVTVVQYARHHSLALEDVDIPKGTISLQRLRDAHIAGIQDAIVILILGQILAAFDVLTTCTGTALILQHCLSLVKPWYAGLSMMPSLDTITIPPILWDTVCCLINGSIPAIKLHMRSSYVVDRVAGLCAPLLPILYDLCVVGHNLRSQVNKDGANEYAVSLEGIRQQVLSWPPTFPSHLRNTFSKEEILGMQAQAAMYRTGILLYIHRLLHAIGIMDGIAKGYADDIVLQMVHYFSEVSAGARLQNTAFPLLMAMTETMSVTTDIWKRLTFLTAPITCVENLLEFVRYVRVQRSNGFTGSLFRLIESGPDFVPLI